MKITHYILILFIFLFIIKNFQNCSNKAKLQAFQNNASQTIDSLNKIIFIQKDSIHSLNNHFIYLNSLIGFKDSLIQKERERANSVERVASKTNIIKLEQKSDWPY